MKWVYFANTPAIPNNVWSEKLGYNVVVGLSSMKKVFYGCESISAYLTTAFLQFENPRFFNTGWNKTGILITTKYEYIKC